MPWHDVTGSVSAVPACCWKWHTTEKKKEDGMCITMGVTMYIECSDKDTWLLKNTFKIENSVCRAPLFLGW